MKKSLEGLQAASGKFKPDNRNGCEKYNGRDDNEWLLWSDEKGKVVYMKHYKVLVEPIAESKDKKKVMKTDKKAVRVEREEKRKKRGWDDDDKEVDKGRHWGWNASTKVILLEADTENDWLLSGEKKELLR